MVDVLVVASVVMFVLVVFLSLLALVVLRLMFLICWFLMYHCSAKANVALDSRARTSGSLWMVQFD